MLLTAEGRENKIIVWHCEERSNPEQSTQQHKKIATIVKIK